MLLFIEPSETTRGWACKATIREDGENILRSYWQMIRSDMPGLNTFSLASYSGHFSTPATFSWVQVISEIILMAVNP
ncbi:MAG: hypothetical protein A4E31_01364 [Methanomassiliicoccales archaeon PtaU1.Bin030]|nr:MAG: hypothetical protein A4E31_01364 [Methanomassiliicoccales archaeon PtaU1.Bin030]